MKQAIMILAHNNIEILRKDILLLNNKNIDIFISIDKKSKLNKDDILKDLFINIKQKGHIEIIKKINTNWGGYSLIESEINLLKLVIKYSNDNNINYNHIHLISGVDMPLKSSNEICKFFSKYKDKEFIHFCGETLSNDIKSRFNYYHYFIDNRYYRNSNLLNRLNRLSLFIQRKIGVSRIKNDFDYQFGAQWFSITEDFAKYILSKENLIRKKFKYSCCCDEVFIQSIFINSPFKNNLYYDKFDSNYIACMRYIDWTRGGPYTFKDDDFDELINSNYLFARKFDYSSNPNVVDKIYKYLNK